MWYIADRIITKCLSAILWWTISNVLYSHGHHIIGINTVQLDFPDDYCWLMRMVKSTSVLYTLFNDPPDLCCVFNSPWVSCRSLRRSACSPKLPTRHSCPSCTKTTRRNRRASASQSRARTPSTSHTSRSTIMPALWVWTWLYCLELTDVLIIQN